MLDVEVDRTVEATIEEAVVETDIGGSGLLPLDLGIVGGRLVHIVPLIAEEVLRLIAAEIVDRLIAVVGNAVLLTGHTISETKLQVADGLHLLEEGLLLDLPCQSDGGEDTPAILGCEAGGSVGTNRRCYEVAVEERVIDTTIEGDKRIPRYIVGEDRLIVLDPSGSLVGVLVILGAPVLVGVARHHIECTEEGVRLRLIIDVEVEELIRLLLAVPVVETALAHLLIGVLIEGSCRGDVDGAVPHAIVVGNVEVHAQSLDEGDLVGDHRVGDDAAGGASVLFLHKEGKGIARGEGAGDHLSIVIGPSEEPVAAEGLVHRRVRHDRLRRIHADCAVDGALVGVTVAGVGALDIKRHGEVVIEEVGREAEVAGDALHVVRLEDPLLVVVTYRHAVGEPGGGATDADVIVRTKGGLVDGALPVGILLAEHSDILRIATLLHDLADLVACVDIDVLTRGGDGEAGGCLYA